MSYLALVLPLFLATGISGGAPEHPNKGEEGSAIERPPPATPSGAPEEETPRTRELSVRSDGGTLAATLYIPAGPGPHPAVVMVQGAGERTRGEWPYRPLAERLADAGFAVLTYDKRGLGASEGRYDEAEDLYVLAGDAAAAYRAARSQPEVAAGRVGFWGKSQGAWLVAAAADEVGDAAFVALDVGGAVTGLDQNVFARQQALAGQGVPADDRRVLERVQRAVWSYYATGEGEEDARAAVARGQEAGVLPAYAWAVPGVPDAGPLPDRGWVEANADGRLRWFRRHLTFDPVPHLLRLDVPVLGIFGSADRLTPTAASVKRLRSEAFAGDRAPLLTVRVFEGADHGICPETPGELIVPGCEWSEGYVDTLVSWLDSVVSRPNGAKSGIHLDGFARTQGDDTEILQEFQGIPGGGSGRLPGGSLFLLPAPGRITE